MHAVFPQQCDLCISMSGGFRAVTHLVTLKSSYVGQTLQNMLHSEDTWQLVGNSIVAGMYIGDLDMHRNTNICCTDIIVCGETSVSEA